MLIEKCFLSILFVTFIVLSNCSSAFSKLIFDKWDKNVIITKEGQEVEEIITMHAELPRHNYYQGWSYIFDSSEKIIIESVIVDRGGSYTFNKNALNLKFGNLGNNEFISFKIKYKKRRENQNDYMIGDFIGFPNWIEGAEANLKLNFPKNLVLYSIHPDAKIIENNIYWKGKIEKGKVFGEIFWFTPKEGRWRVKITGSAIGSNRFKKASLSIPEYFKNGPYKIEQYNILTNVSNNYEIKTKNAYHHFTFANVNSRLLSAEVEAIISNGENNRVNLNLDPTNFLNYQKKYDQIFSGIIKNIRETPEYSDFDEHVKLAMWVNGHIKYDESLVGADLSIEEILRVKRGACSHYATLYSELLRFVGIPSFPVAGISYSIEKGGIQDHSWNYVYVMGKWIPIDPTWGIYSGILPISHIFTYGRINDVNVEFTAYDYENFESIKTNIRNKVEFLN